MIALKLHAGRRSIRLTLTLDRSGDQKRLVDCSFERVSRGNRQTEMSDDRVFAFNLPALQLRLEVRRKRQRDHAVQVSEARHGVEINDRRVSTVSKDPRNVFNFSQGTSPNPANCHRATTYRPSPDDQPIGLALRTASYGGRP